MIATRKWIILFFFMLLTVSTANAQTARNPNQNVTSTLSDRAESQIKRIELRQLGQVIGGGNIEGVVRPGETWYVIEQKKGKTAFVYAFSMIDDHSQMQKDVRDASEERTMMLNISIECEKNDRVGNEWISHFELNGHQVWPEAMPVAVIAGETLALCARFCEMEKSPDVGECLTQYVPSESEAAKGFTVVQKVIVEEDKGRYVGCRAEWIVTYAFSPVAAN